MANVLIFTTCLMLVLSGVDSCFIPQDLYVHVPETIHPGDKITQVDVDGCARASLTVSDPSFEIRGNGVVVASAAVSVVTTGRTFSVRARDSSGGQEREMEVHLLQSAAQKKQHTGEGVLRRFRRRWGPPTFHILENEQGPFPKDIEMIGSDSAAKYNVYYTFSGPGFDEVPKDVFSLDRETGMLKMHKPVDREMFPSFTLITRVFDKRTHQQTDEPLPITIQVDDMNDNAPTFTDPLSFSVPEQSSPGTIVGKVNATDRDEQGSLHVDIRYTLLNGLELFAINAETGVITIPKKVDLDRETKDKYLVTIQIKDMRGASDGLSHTGTATITLTDINDNPPTFKKTSYDVTVNENENDKLILRIPVDDKDLKDTPNWIAKFAITKGNENGNFRIDTDPETNEGRLYVAKPLDYEKNKNVKLEIMARNEAELSGTTANWASIPVDVSVVNIDEGPQFTAPTITFKVKENTPNGTVIGSYTAVDPETKSSAGMTYYKVTDPGSWISVDKNTGELRVANTIDRESPLVQDGIYNITMKAVDASGKTGKGTVILIVDDANDNKPKVPAKLVMCETDGLSSVVVVAEDKDQAPYSAPFSFSLPPDDDGKWSLTPLNGTAATLKQVKELHTGIHSVKMKVTDLQGNGEEQTVEVRICQCRNGVCLDKKSSVSLGPMALLAMLLPLALLLLLGLLLAFFCATKTEARGIDDIGDSGGILLKSNTEAPGEEVDSSLITGPSHLVDQAAKGSVKGSMLNSGWLGNKSSSTMGGHSIHENGMHKGGVVAGDMQEYYSAHYDSQYGAQQFNHLTNSGVDIDSRYLAQDSAFLHTWQTNGRYLQQKLGFLGTEEDGRYADDIIHAYGFEGVGSAAGSVGCCSEYGDNDNLDFLNTLGPKFKTLAEVCSKR